MKSDITFREEPALVHFCGTKGKLKIRKRSFYFLICLPHHDLIDRKMVSDVVFLSDLEFCSKKTVVRKKE